VAWRERLRSEWAVSVVLLVFLALAGTYSVVTPMFEAPDELHHYFYVKHIADGNPLPVQDPANEGLWAQEGSQPPLYYAMGAMVSFWVNTDDALSLLWPNQHANMGDPLDPGNKNRVVHTEREGWPYRGMVLAVHLVRWLSVLMGAGTVYLTFRLARDLLPGRPGLAEASAALVACIPQFCFISAAVTNDNLIILLSTLAVWLLLRVLQERATRLTFVALGLTLGCAALTKLSGAGLLPLAGFILAVHAIRERSWQALWREGGIVFGLALAVAGWWYVRNWRLYGDPTGLSRMLDVAGRRGSTNGLQLLSELEGLRISFWGLFGWFNILLPRWTYKVLDGVSLAGLAGLMFGVLRQPRGQWPSALWWLLLPSAWLTLLFAGLARWTHLTPATQGRLLFPAVSGAAVLLVLGWSQLVPKSWRPAWLAVLLIPLLALAAASPFLFIAPAYAPPHLLSVDEIPAEARLDSPRSFRLRNDLVRLAGAKVSPETVWPGGQVEVVVYWEALRPMSLDLTLFIHLLGRNMEQAGGLDTYPGWGSYPTRLWKPGQVVEDRYLVPVRHDSAAPTRLLVDVGLYYEPTNTGLRVVNDKGEEGSGLIGGVRLVRREAPEYLSQYAVDFVLGEQVALRGYDLPQHTVQVGRPISVTLYWQGLVPMVQDYTAFVHLVDAEERIVVQNDKPPLDGDWPTSAWQPLETVPDTYTLLVPPDTPVGTYQLHAGLYLLGSPGRLPVVGQSGRIVSDKIIIDEINVTASEALAGGS
jgi:hypothetical protein